MDGQAAEPTPDWNPVWRGLYPSKVGDVVAVRHAFGGRLRLHPLRTDRPAVEALCAALRSAGARLDGPAPHTLSVVVHFDPARTDLAALLAAPIRPLPLPAARLDLQARLRASLGDTWAVLSDAKAPPWRAPALLRVEPQVATSGAAAAWWVSVSVGTLTFVRDLRVVRVETPRVIELTLTGKLNGVIRYDLEPEAAKLTRLRQRFWFQLSGGSVEAGLGTLLVERFAQRYVRAAAANLEAWFQHRARQTTVDGE